MTGDTPEISYKCPECGEEFKIPTDVMVAGIAYVEHRPDGHEPVPMKEVRE